MIVTVVLLTYLVFLKDGFPCSDAARTVQYRFLFVWGFLSQKEKEIVSFVYKSDQKI